MDNETRKILARIDALFAKADSTDSQHEAEALVAKAQELLTKHHLDRAMARGAREEQIITDRIEHGAGSPGSQALASLAVTVARANNCVVTYGHRRKTLEFKGYESDVAIAVMMHASLTAQMINAYQRSRVNKPQHVHGLTWRTSFSEGFCARVSQRVRDGQKTAETGADEHALVLVRNRLAEIERATGVNYGRRTANVRSATGYESGKSAGSRADLGGSNRVTSGARRALGA